jgi:ubiquinone/menaquinone biosynthesis C-methylase UbiE
MPLTTNEWHNRYKLQTRWTEKIRGYLLQRAGFTPTSLMLDVGCGTGAVLEDMQEIARSTLSGIDINQKYLTYTSQRLPDVRLTQGNAYYLPFPEHTFDICFCHFLLLWLTNPDLALIEMRRVTRSGGAVIAFAEPDYGGRIDFPEELSILGQWQTQSLKRQKADPLIGRKLRSLFFNAGLVEIEAGVLGGKWKGIPAKSEQENELEILRSDLDGELEKLIRLDRLVDLDNKAWEQEYRILYIPTFYAWGRVP